MRNEYEIIKEKWSELTRPAVHSTVCRFISYFNDSSYLNRGPYSPLTGNGVLTHPVQIIRMEISSFDLDTFIYYAGSETNVQ